MTVFEKIKGLYQLTPIDSNGFVPLEIRQLEEHLHVAVIMKSLKNCSTNYQ